MAVVQTAAFLAGILAQGGLDFYHNESEFLATISDSDSDSDTLLGLPPSLLGDRDSSQAKNSPRPGMQNLLRQNLRRSNCPSWMA